MKASFILAAIALLALSAQTIKPPSPPPILPPILNVREIVQRSVANTKANWDAAPQFNFTESDVLIKHGEKTTKTYQVLMIDGSPYDYVASVDGQPVPRASKERDLRAEIARRGEESPGARRRRIAEYEKQRRQDHALMEEMVSAFDYTFTAEATVNGRRCYVIAGTPRPGYFPSSHETKVLEGMRGTLWIDAERYQWVKVHAEVFRPVEFGFFIAHVDPGTEMTLEQQPVDGNIWLPCLFSLHVQAKIFFYQRDYTDEETYASYQRAANVITRVQEP